MFSKARLDTLSDGIFGVAMTLLVLDVRLPENFHPHDNAELIQGLLDLWPKFLPYVLSFGVLGLRWLANIEVRTRAEYVNREYVNWWLLYLLLITCVPFTTIVVGTYGHFAPAIWLYAGHTLLIAAVGLRLIGDHAASGAGRSSGSPAIFGVLLIASSLLAIALSFVHPRGALWALALNFATPIHPKMEPPRRSGGLNRAAPVCRLRQGAARAPGERDRTGRGTMNWLPFRVAMVFSFAALFVAPATPAQAEKRVALVIGNNDYKNVPKLQKAVNDARTMGDTLKQLGFTVMVAENQTRQAFSETLLAFDNAVGPGDTAFFFYAGHGFEIAGQNFLLPTDVPAAGEGQEELVRDASVLADRIIERLQNKNVRTAILVFDACRNNPFERSGTRALAGGGGLAPMTQLPEGVFSVFSAGPRQTALDRLSNSDDNPNSVFTRTFAKELLQPGENLVQVAQHTRRTVSEWPKASTTSRSRFISTRWSTTSSSTAPRKDSDKGGGKTARAAAAGRSLAAGVGAARRAAAKRFRQCADRGVLPPQWRLDRGVLDPRSGASAFPGGWATAAISRKPASSTRSIRAPASGFPIPRSSLPPTLPAATIQVRYVDMSRRNAGPVSDKIRSGGRADP